MDCGELTCVDAQRYVDGLPSIVDRATAKATEKFKKLILQRRVNEGNFGETAEVVANDVVYTLRLNTGNELVDLELFQIVLANLLELCPLPPAQSLN